MACVASMRRTQHSGGFRHSIFRVHKIANWANHRRSWGQEAGERRPWRLGLNRWSHPGCSKDVLQRFDT